MNYMPFFIILLTTPLLGGPNCMDNSEYLQKAYDTKEWHSVECYCRCETIKGRHCIECGHLQNAQTYDVIQPTNMKTHTRNQTKIRIPDTPQNIFRKLAAQYLLNK